MSIDLSIIPILQTDETYAEDVMEKIKSTSNLQVVDITINKDYNSSLKNRIDKQLRLEKIIIVVDNSNSKIIVRFPYKGSRATKMDIDDFIELYLSLDGEEGEEEKEEEEGEEEEVKKEEGEDDNSGCIIA
jgi:hypothetical protein